MSKFCAITVLCLMVTSIFLQTSLAIAPDLDVLARTLYRDLDRLMNPDPRASTKDDPPMNGSTYPLHSAYKIYREVRAQTPEIAIVSAAKVLFIRLVQPAILFYYQPDYTNLRNKIIARIEKYFNIHRTAGVQDDDIPGMHHLMIVIATIHFYEEMLDSVDEGL